MGCRTSCRAGRRLSSRRGPRFARRPWGRAAPSGPRRRRAHRVHRLAPRFPAVGPGASLGGLARLWAFEEGVGASQRPFGHNATAREGNDVPNGAIASISHTVAHRGGRIVTKWRCSPLPSAVAQVGADGGPAHLRPPSPAGHGWPRESPTRTEPHCERHRGRDDLPRQVRTGPPGPTDAAVGGPTPPP